MRIFGKTYSYWKEIIGGIVVGIIISLILIFFFSPKLSEWKDFMKGIPSLCITVFGFLLTLLSIILQGNSPTINWMRSRKKTFNRFVDYNKRIILLSFIISIYSYILGFFNFKYHIEQLPLSDCIVNLLQKIVISIFFGLLVWFVIDTLHFIKVFYALIKEKDQN